ncbi:TadE family protein [Actinomyces sp. Chiba101]|uniref:TadE family protein n=1 Tax=Actinomyces TaxID=1654 RepID=UPI000974E5CE|nr:MULTISPECIES: TadE family protein [Actinomyces]BAW94118.1 TadE family protein [Actinomyces sp. Chiba101]GAV95322.1 TadE family protein [Actinomyces denticolens]SUU13757.1 Flp pilus assembly protein TadG [Actinomyces denticolens]
MRAGAVITRARRARREERGASSVEMVVIAPVLILVAMLIVAMGRWVSTEGRVQAAARDAARAASFERSASAASEASSRALASSDVADKDCASTTNTSGFARGGRVEVTVRCRVPLSDLGLAGLPGIATIEGSGTAPVDTWRGTR